MMIMSNEGKDAVDKSAPSLPSDIFYSIVDREEGRRKLQRLFLYTPWPSNALLIHDRFLGYQIPSRSICRASLLSAHIQKGNECNPNREIDAELPGNGAESLTLNKSRRYYFEVRISSNMGSENERLNNPVWQRSVAGTQSRLFLCPLSARLIGENQLIICLFVLFHFLTFIEQADSARSSPARWISLLEPRGVSRPLKWTSISSLVIE